MIREIIDMVPFRSLAQELINCWLSYTMSQPVQFDIALLFLFALQYVGFHQIWILFQQYKSCFKNLALGDQRSGENHLTDSDRYLFG
jgi:hypothetical protein